MLSVGAIINLQNLVNQHIKQLHEYTPSSMIYSLEARFTLVQLQKILLKSDKGLTHRLKHFLKSRWYWIENSDAMYTHDFINPANTAAIAVAKALEDKDTPYIKLLIPSLEHDKNKIHYVSSALEDLTSLKECILIRQNTCLLNIADLIESAQAEGLLRPNFLTNGKITVLRKNERKYVYAKHPTIIEAYSAIHQLVTFMYQGNSAGAALKRLIQGLLGGGRQMGASEDDCDTEANLAIAAFSNYLEFLTDEAKAMLLSTQKFDRFFVGPKDPEWLSIEKLWGHLSRDKNTNYNDIHFCVELIAQRLDEILRDNPELYKLVPILDKDEKTLENLTEAVHLAREKMRLALEDLTQFIWFGKEGERRYLNRFLRNMLHYDKTYQLTAQEVRILLCQYEAYSSSEINQCVQQIIGRLEQTTCEEVRDSISIIELPKFDALYAQATRQEPPLSRHSFYNKKRTRDERTSTDTPTLIISQYSDSLSE